MPTLPFVRIAVTPEIENILQSLRPRYPALKDPEFFKIGFIAFSKVDRDTEALRNELMLKYISEELDKIAKKMEKLHKGKYQNTAISIEDIDAHSF